jgi:hypothetical protein
MDSHKIIDVICFVGFTGGVFICAPQVINMCLNAPSNPVLVLGVMLLVFIAWTYSKLAYWFFKRIAEKEDDLE